MYIYTYMNTYVYDISLAGRILPGGLPERGDLPTGASLGGIPSKVNFT